MRILPLAGFAALGLSFAGGAVTACDDMNRPTMGVPTSEPRHKCFSDIECPGSKCLKTVNEAQGICASALDGGAEDVPPGPPSTPPPSPSGTSAPPRDPNAPAPSPNDIHI